MSKIRTKLDYGYQLGCRVYKSNLLEYICGLLLIGLTLVCFIQVVTRYFLITQWGGWAEEFSRLFFVWGVFLGALVAVKRDVHLGVDLIVNRLRAGGRLQRGFILLKHLCMLAVSVLLVRYGIKYVIITAGDHMTTLGYPRNFFYLPAPLSGFLMVIYLIPRVVRDIGALFGLGMGDNGRERRNLTCR